MEFFFRNMSLDFDSFEYLFTGFKLFLFTKNKKI